jgi:hypothetical protein
LKINSQNNSPPGCATTINGMSQCYRETHPHPSLAKRGAGLSPLLLAREGAGG